MRATTLGGERVGQECARRARRMQLRAWASVCTLSHPLGRTPHCCCWCQGVFWTRCSGKAIASVFETLLSASHPSPLGRWGVRLLDGQPRRRGRWSRTGWRTAPRLSFSIPCTGRSLYMEAAPRPSTCIHTCSGLSVFFRAYGAVFPGLAERVFGDPSGDCEEV